MIIMSNTVVIQNQIQRFFNTSIYAATTNEGNKANQVNANIPAACGILPEQNRANVRYGEHAPMINSPKETS